MINLTICLSYLLQVPGDQPTSETFRVDHFYPGSENRTVIAILYGELGTVEFTQFHKVLKAQAVEGKIGYVLRHYVKVSSAKLAKFFLHILDCTVCRNK